MPVINIKPLSVNKAFQGRRFKTPEYKRYTDDVLVLLPAKMNVPDGYFMVELTFGVSNMQADVDNPVKPFVDILQKKYNFNDSRIVEMLTRKVKVKKGDEYISFEFKELKPNA